MSRRVMLAAVLALLWPAPAALAQEDGVHVDPDSPTGKEYALPLDSVRRAADPSGRSAADAAGAAPLFGAGIVTSSGGAEPTDAAAQGDGGSAAPDGTSGGGDGGTAAGSAAARDAPAAVAAAAQSPGAPSGGLSTPLIFALAAAGLLLIGGLAGVVIRRTRG